MLREKIWEGKREERRGLRRGVKSMVEEGEMNL